VTSPAMLTSCSRMWCVAFAGSPLNGGRASEDVPSLIIAFSSSALPRVLAVLVDKDNADILEHTANGTIRCRC